MGSGASSQTSGVKETIPGWVYTIKIPAEYANDKLGTCSEGMCAVGPNTVTRNRTGNQDTDGARWGRGFTSGKHTFEIVFPMTHRGVQATVGVATEEAALQARNRVPLVGLSKHSWGICLRQRRAYHKNSVVKKYPQMMQYLPDKFYMYVDADAGLLQFGSDLDYYGTAISNIPHNQPLYPMVAATVQGAIITIVYRGQGDTSAIGPPPPCVVPAAPQMMSPHLRTEPPPPPPPTVVSNTHPSAPTNSEPVQQKVIEEQPELLATAAAAAAAANSEEKEEEEKEEEKEAEQEAEAKAKQEAEDKEETLPVDETKPTEPSTAPAAEAEA